MKKNLKITITNGEDHALNMIKGMPEDAFYLLVSAKNLDDSRVLSGSVQAFENLLSTLQEEVDYRLSPKSRIHHLCRVIEKIELIMPEVDPFDCQ